MSIRALNWAIEACREKGLNANAKLVLWQIADAHNIEHGSFVSQQTIAAGVEIHRATVNRCLDELVAAKLVSRERRVDRATGKQLSTRYRLAFEIGFVPQDVVAHVAQCDTDTPGPSGEKVCDQDVENDASRVANDPSTVSRLDATLTSSEPINPLPPSDEAGFATLCELWPSDHLGDVERAASAYHRLSPEDRAKALAEVDSTRRQFYALDRPLPKLRGYLSERAWEEFIGAPPIIGGAFRIEAGTPEWSRWLKFYEKNATVYLGMKRQGYLLVPTRWPPGNTPSPTPESELA